MISRAVVLAAISLAGALLGCGTQPGKQELGKLPSAVTTAEPEWLPFAIRAGARAPDDPRETRLSDLREVPAAGTVSRVAWAADGRSLVLENELGVVVLDLSTGQIVRVSDPGERATHGVSAGSHGEYVVYATSPDPSDSKGPRIVSVRRDGTDRTELGESGVLPVTAGDGSGPLDALFFFRSSGAKLEMHSMRATADALSFHGVFAQSFERVVDYAVSGDRTRAAWLTKDGDLQLGSLAARGEVRTIRTLGADGVSSPAFHPTANHVVVSTTVDDPQAQLALVDLDDVEADVGVDSIYRLPQRANGRRVERVTFALGGARAPAFSRDGRYLAFVSARFAPGPLVSPVEPATHLYVARWRAEP